MSAAKDSVDRAHGGLTSVSLEEFTAVDEIGARSMLGTADDAPIAENTMCSCTATAVPEKDDADDHLALCLAAGDSWLGIDAPRRLRVLIVELEGPRPFSPQAAPCSGGLEGIAGRRVGAGARVRSRRVRIGT